MNKKSTFRKVAKDYLTHTNKERGITLIVLIITIIIMLILVGVTIDITVDNGLFNNAKEAVDKTNNKVAQIQNRTNELMDMLNDSKLKKIISGKNIIIVLADYYDYVDSKPREEKIERLGLEEINEYTVRSTILGLPYDEGLNFLCVVTGCFGEEYMEEYPEIYQYEDSWIECPEGISSPMDGNAILSIFQADDYGRFVIRVGYSEEEIVEEVVSVNKEIIKFKIDGTEYSAEMGMTWGEWLESEYNNDNNGFFDYLEIFGNVDPESCCQENQFIVPNWNYITRVVQCFAAGTKIQCNLNGESKNIEEFKTGDKIVSYNIFTNKFYEAEVTKLIVHEGEERVTSLSDIVFADGSILNLTPNHPVYTSNGFKAIENNKYEKLNIGDYVQTTSGLKQVVDIKVYNCEPTVVYNLKIKDYEEVIDNDKYDTYIANGVVVHNMK